MKYEIVKKNEYLTPAFVTEDEGERLVRRVSYLKATSGDRMYSDSELDSDTDDKS